MRCVTLMVNRSDRRFPTLSAAMAREAARLISTTKRAEVHQGPGPHLTPDKQAGYMTATEFQNRVCNSTLARGRGPYMNTCSRPQSFWGLRPVLFKNYYESCAIGRICFLNRPFFSKVPECGCLNSGIA